MKRGYESFGNTNKNENLFVMNYVFEWYLRAFCNNVSFRHFSMPQKPINNGGCVLWRGGILAIHGAVADFVISWIGGHGQKTLHSLQFQPHFRRCIGTCLSTIAEIGCNCGQPVGACFIGWWFRWWRCCATRCYQLCFLVVFTRVL